MTFDWDSDKAVDNLVKHGRGFPMVIHFDFDSALIRVDDRHDYGETRYTALGMIGSRLHVLVFTLRGETVRVISLRRANERERARYEQT